MILKKGSRASSILRGNLHPMKKQLDNEKTPAFYERLSRDGRAFPSKAVSDLARDIPPKGHVLRRRGLSASLGCRKALKLQAAHWRFQLGARVAAVKRHHCLQGDEYARPWYGIRGYAQFEAFSFVRDSFRNFNGAIKGDLPWREKC